MVKDLSEACNKILQSFYLAYAMIGQETVTYVKNEIISLKEIFIAYICSFHFMKYETLQCCTDMQ